MANENDYPELLGVYESIAEVQKALVTEGALAGFDSSTGIS
jgi:hypothetical protein